jgi:hypothetical protein
VKHSDRSWLSLLGFFAIVTLGSSLIFAAVFASVTAAFAGGEAEQTLNDQRADPQLVPAQTFSGMITDSRCGARHTDSGKSASECTRICVRDGSRYVMVDGDKRYELNGKPEQLAQLAGQRVTLTGVLSEGMIKVNSASVQGAKIGE